jgi:hypothetical protein
MINDIIIVDNVFKNPDSLINLAKEQAFYTSLNHPEFENGAKWEGSRSSDLVSQNKEKFLPFFNELLTRTLETTFVSLHSNVKKHWYFRSYFHLLTEENIFSKDWIHTDQDVSYAGIVYLSKDLDNTSGTTIFKNKKEIYIEDVFNRLVMYRADYEHSAKSGFGQSVHNGRLTLNFFVKQIYFEISNHN